MALTEGDDDLIRRYTVNESDFKATLAALPRYGGQLCGKLVKMEF